jgi:outer membrane protein OmpA-like peptidoglycan-associated protein
MAVLENRATIPQTNEPIVIFGHLFDFVIGSATLRKDHREWLQTIATPFLNGNDQATFLLHGFASRSGSSRESADFSATAQNRSGLPHDRAAKRCSFQERVQ